MAWMYLCAAAIVLQKTAGMRNANGGSKMHAYVARQWMKQKRSEGRGMDNLDDMQDAEAMHAMKKKMITFG